MSKEKYILVIADGSKEMEVALQYACARSKKTNRKIIIATFIEPLDVLTTQGVTEIMQTEAREEAESKLQQASSIVNGAVKGMYGGGIIDGPDEIVTNKAQLQTFVTEASQPAMKGMMLNAMEMQKQMLTDTAGASQQNITSGNVGAIDNSSTTIVTAKAPNPNSSMFREIDAENYRGV